MSTDVILLNAPSDAPKFWDLPSFTNEHIGIGYLASSLREANFNTRIFSIHDFNNPYLLLKKIIKSSPILVGFTLTHANIRNTIKFLRLLKPKMPTTHITAGGHHATFSGREILKYEKHFDSIILGEGEETVVDLVDHLKNKRQLDSVAGLIFRNPCGEIRVNMARKPIVDLDVLPWPARDILEEEMKKSLNPGVARILTSRGCIGNCSFCTTPSMIKIQNTDGWRKRSPDDVLREISYLVSRGAKTFFINDDDFIGPGNAGKKHAIEIAQLIIEHNLKIEYDVELRTFDILQEDEPLLALLRRSGLRCICMGIESGSRDCLRRYNKLSNLKYLDETIVLLKKYNIVLEPGFIMFDPYSTFDDIVKNVELLRFLEQDHLYKHFSMSLGLYPGTPIFNQAIKDGFITQEGRYKENAHHYLFRDANIGSLYKHISSLLPQMLPIDHMLFDLDLKVTRKIRYNDTSASYIKNVRKLKEDRSALNREFFNKLTLFFKNRRSREEPTTITNKWFNKAYNVNNKIEVLWNKSNQEK